MITNSGAVNPPRRPFDFSANHLALDFTNTVSGRPIFTRDDLACPDDIIEWAAAAGTVKHVAQLAGQPQEWFEAALVLRENLYRMFAPIADGGPPEPKALAFVTRRAAQAVRSAEWHRGEVGYVLRWPDASIDAICDRLADEAVQLLRSPQISRVGACAGCGWLFLDVSRAHARRWCSMNVCGVRDKMRRYHQRQSGAVRA